MISILIPIYDYPVVKLVEDLNNQGKKLAIPFEIIVFDDGSKSEFNMENEKLNSIQNVTFKSLDKNVGLSQNRNLLASTAQYENLLFIDGDSIVTDGFFKKYREAIDSSSEVIYGGRIHPSDYLYKKQSLRWKYGFLVEDKSAEERKKTPYRSTLFNNTLIKKELFETVKFESKISKYGHEDTLFSYELKKLKTRIKHIENPVIHGDIDSNERFLSKMHLSLNNLKRLCEEGWVDSNYVKLSKYHKRLKKIGLDKIVGWTYGVLKKPIQRNLTSKTPLLWIFAAFRLGYFCKINL